MHGCAYNTARNRWKDLVGVSGVKLDAGCIREEGAMRHLPRRTISVLLSGRSIDYFRQKKRNDRLVYTLDDPQIKVSTDILLHGGRSCVCEVTSATAVSTLIQLLRQIHTPNRAHHLPKVTRWRNGRATASCRRRPPFLFVGCLVQRYPKILTPLNYGATMSHMCARGGGIMRKAAV